MTDREDTDLRAGHPGTEREWKEYAVQLTLTFWAYEGSEKDQAESLVAITNQIVPEEMRLDITRPAEYPQEV